MFAHDFARGYVAPHQSDDSVAHVLAVWTVACCVLDFAFAVSLGHDAGRSLTDRDSTQVLNYHEAN